jgi:hypothetical protein
VGENPVAAEGTILVSDTGTVGVAFDQASATVLDSI